MRALALEPDRKAMDSWNSNITVSSNKIVIWQDFGEYRNNAVINNHVLEFNVSLRNPLS